MNFSFLQDETTKLGPQRIMVKSSDASQQPLSASLSICLRNFYFGDLYEYSMMSHYHGNAKIGI